MNDIAKTAPQYIEVAVNSTYDINGNRHVREYSNQYQKVVIRHDNNFIVSEVRLVGFIEKHLHIVITRELMNWYSVEPEDADEDMPDFTNVRFGRTSVSELSREDVIRELMKYVTDTDGRKIERLLADIITHGISNEPLDAEFVVDFYLSMADRYCASIGSEKRAAFLKYLEQHKPELETYFTRKFITPDFDFFTKFDAHYIDNGSPLVKETEAVAAEISERREEKPEKKKQPKQPETASSGKKTANEAVAKEINVKKQNPVHDIKTVRAKSEEKSSAKEYDKDQFKAFIKRMEMQSKKLKM